MTGERGENMPALQWIDEKCNICSRQLNSWDVRLSKALTYEYPVCESCIANEYDMDTDTVRSYFEEVFGLRPCTGL